MNFRFLKDLKRSGCEASDIVQSGDGAEDESLSLLKIAVGADFESARQALDEIERRLNGTPAYPTRLRAGYSWKPLLSVAKAALQRHPDRLGLAALLSISSDGHVRELAVKHLAALPNGRGLPYLVTRSSDWIPVVSTTAEHSLASLFGKASDSDVILAVRAAYAASKRERHVGWVLSATVVEMLKRPRAVKMASSLPAPVIRWVSERLERDGFNSEEWGLGCPDIVVRAKAFSEKITGAQSADEQVDLLRRLLKDPASGIRALAFGPLTRGWDIPKETYERALLDPNRVVRRSAQFLEPEIRKPRDFYYANLDKPNSIRGLSDFHLKEDLPAFRHALKSEQAMIRRAALESVSALNDRNSIPDILPLLEDAPTSRAALKALIHLAATLDPDVLTRIAADSTRDLQVRQTAVRGLTLVSRWDEVASLLKLMQEQELRRLIVHRLARWRAWFDRRPTRPGEKYEGEIAAAIEAGKPWLSEDWQNLFRAA